MIRLYQTACRIIDEVSENIVYVANNYNDDLRGGFERFLLLANILASAQFQSSE